MVRSLNLGVFRRRDHRDHHHAALHAGAGGLVHAPTIEPRALAPRATAAARGRRLDLPALRLGVGRARVWRRRALVHSLHCDGLVERRLRASALERADGRPAARRRRSYCRRRVPAMPSCRRPAASKDIKELAARGNNKDGQRSLRTCLLPPALNSAPAGAFLNARTRHLPLHATRA